MLCAHLPAVLQKARKEMGENLFISESAYEIEMEKTESAGMLACPRCGHLQERKARSVCASCKRFIPSVNSKQKWAPEKKLLYADMEQYFPKDDEAAASECKFVKSRRTFSYLRLARNVAVLAALCAGVYYAGPRALKATMGETSYSKMEGSIHQSTAQLIKPFAQGKKLAANATKRSK